MTLSGENVEQLTDEADVCSCSNYEVAIFGHQVKHPDVESHVLLGTVIQKAPYANVLIIRMLTVI